MKKIAYIALIVGLVLGSLQCFPTRAEARGQLAFGSQLFEGAGSAVENAAEIGGVIGGVTTGIVAGIPLGIVGVVLGAPFNKAIEGGSAGVMIPASAGSVLGQVALGTLVLIPKVLFYDAPKALLNPETYNFTDK